MVLQKDDINNIDRIYEQLPSSKDNGKENDALNTRNRQLDFLGQITRKEGLGNAIHTKQIEGNREREKTKA